MMRQALPIESIQLREARSLAQRRSRALIRGDGCGRFLCAFAFGLALLFDLFTAAALAAFIGAAGAIGPLAVGNIPAAALEVNRWSSQTPHDFATLTICAGWCTLVRKRLDVLEFVTTILADKFVDWHDDLSFNKQFS